VAGQRRAPKRRASTLPPNAPPELVIARLERRNQKLTALLDVAKAMTAEHNLDHLLDIILAESVGMVDAERGSLFIMGRDRKTLWSKIAHGMDAEIIKLTVGSGVAGHVAETGEILNIPDAYADERFDRAWDDRTGFKTDTILCVPMLGQNRSVVGVIQALNHAGGPFTEDDEELLMALGANAAAAIENANLYEDIEQLFDAFVSASVTAIEARDPSTSGHSSRVAEFSVTLIEQLPRAGGAFSSLSFGEREIREMRYAALLHDFGKVGVREQVLLKAAKLHPHELALLEARFEQAKRCHQVRFLERRLELAETGPDRDRMLSMLDDMEGEWQRVDADLDAMLDLVRRCNEPSVMAEGNLEGLDRLADARWVDTLGRSQTLIQDHERLNLAIPRGSLNAEERLEIERHVSHTYNFLRQIPWTADLARVPEFAHGHHEKLDGSGYPLGLAGDAIPLQTRVMTIADIYDALTATDRPYKKALSHERALAILENEAGLEKIDGDILQVFIEADIARLALTRL